MTLYTLCIQPFLKMLKQRLTGVRIGRRNGPISVVAYAHDVTIFLTSVTKLPAIEDAIRLFEKASGAHFNTRKSQVLPIGRWNTTANIIGLQYHPHVKILGVHFWSTIHKSINATWTQLPGKVRAQAKEAYSRDLCLAHRISYVHPYLLSKIWYSAQLFPSPGLHTQQLTSAVNFVIWKGATFRVPVSTLQAQKRKGGWELIDINQM